MARTPDGHDVAIRVIVVKNEGHEHLNILRKIAKSPQSLFSNNHALPMFGELQFEDITFGFFPRVGASMEDAIGSWPRNSVGDVMDMILQALEALAFIHESNIAHRDTFYDNFLVQWHPESMCSMSIPVSRPRVYLIDFEVAIELPAEGSPEQRLVTGYPLGGSFPDPDMCSRPPAPEMTTREFYCPFKLDVWQLARGFAELEFKTTIAEIDTVMHDMVHAHWTSRMSANEALNKLRNVIGDMPPTSLLIRPEVDRGY